MNVLAKIETTPLSNRLKSTRERRGLTQEQVSEKINVEIGTLSGYERAYRKPSPDMLLKLADLYGVSTDYLLGRVDNPTDELVPTTTEPLDHKATYMNDLVTDDIVDNLKLMSREDRETIRRLTQSIVNRKTEGVS